MFAHASLLQSKCHQLVSKLDQQACTIRSSNCLSFNVKLALALGSAGLQVVSGQFKLWPGLSKGSNHIILASYVLWLVFHDKLRSLIIIA